MTPATPLEDRIRAHLAERTANEPLPGPDPETALADTLRRAAEHDVRGVPAAARAAWLATAAAALAVLAAAAVAVVVIRQDDGVTMHPGPDEDPTITTSPSTSGG